MTFDRNFFEKQAFLESLRTYIANLESYILQIDQGNSNIELNDIFYKMFIEAHNIKGASGMIGYKNLSKLAHLFETLLTKFRYKTNLQEDDVNLLYKVIDALKLLLIEFQKDGSDNQDYINDLIKDLNNVIVSLNKSSFNKKI